MSILYHIVRSLARVAIRVFFRKIYFHRGDTLQRGKPTILAVNHPTAFLDPVFVASHIKPVTYTMLRGDLFNKPWKRWLLGQIKNIPIFRFRDGFSGMKQNQETFDRCYQLLHEKAFILILAEGNMKHEKRLRPIQKGTARMAFGAYEAHGDRDIEIIPVGVNYSDSNQFRSILMASVGEPIRIADYLDTYAENPRKAVLQVTRQIEAQLKDRVIHMQENADAPWVNHLLTMNRNNFIQSAWPPVETTNQLLQEEIAITRSINELADSDKVIIEQKINQYFTKIHAVGITDRGIAHSQKANPLAFIGFLVTFPIFCLGYLTNFFPLTTALHFANKNIKIIEFFSSVRLGVYLALYVIQYLLLLIIAALVGNAYLWALILLVPFAGYFAILYSDQWNWFREAQRAKKVDFKNQRKSLVELIEKLK